MEDNEFEDVLVISYTDRGSSILPQSTAERIMKNIRLEVTQKVTHNSNENSNQPGHFEENLLDKFRIKNKQSLSYQGTGFIGYNSRSQCFMIGHGSEADIMSDIPEKNYRLKMPSTHCEVHYILPWNDYIVVFAYSDKPKVYLGTTLIHTGNQVFGGNMSWHVHSTQKYFYYRSQNFQLIRMNGETFEETVMCDGKAVSDFTVDARDESVVTLSPIGIIKNHKTLHTVDISASVLQKQTAYPLIKQSYLKNLYLAVSSNNTANQNTVHLVWVSSRTIKIIDSMSIDLGGRSASIAQIRLCRPVRGVNLFAFPVNRQLHLWGIYQGKLTKLSHQPTNEHLASFAFIQNSFYCGWQHFHVHINNQAKKLLYN